MERQTTSRVSIAHTCHLPCRQPYSFGAPDVQQRGGILNDGRASPTRTPGSCLEQARSVAGHRIVCWFLRVIGDLRCPPFYDLSVCSFFPRLICLCKWAR
ncbi:unnamed protein product [Ectocarpus sp. 12 AP-2014]